MVMAPTCGAPQEARVRVIVALGAFVWDAALRTIVDHRNSCAPQCDAVRVDVISILVLSEDRALLRHYRGERSG